MVRDLKFNKNFTPKISRYIKKFSPKTMEFLLWQIGFEHLLEFFQIAKEDKVKLLLEMMEPEIMRDIEEKVSPDPPHLLSYDELIHKLEEMYSPYTGFEAAEYRFVNRYQIIGETISEYVHALKTIIINCYPDVRTKAHLLAQFIIGIRSEAGKSILKKDKNLTLEKAIAMAKQLEKVEVKFYFNGI
ncbi:hypothetical protein M0804_013263 [Polistes exclamans]|nr:hypothetical protein M0804_013263 [Polistes exclamans]